MQKSEALALARKKTILVIGDVMLDRFVYGSVERISPEAPTPVLSHAREVCMLGGAANVAANIAGLGARVQLLGVVGNDSAGETFLSLLKQSGISAGNIIVDPKRPTTEKTRYVARDHHLLRVDREETSLLSESITKKIRTNITRALKACDVVVCADYNKGVLDEALIAWLMKETKIKHIPLIADAKQKTLRLYKRAWLVAPNEHEAITATGIADPIQAALSLKKDLDCSVLLTQGANGMTLFEGKNTKHVPAYAHGVIDVSGAGDTVVAAIAVMQAVGMPLVQAVDVASLAASIAVQKRGTASVSVEELLAGSTLQDSSKKSMAVKKLAEVVASLRKQKQHARIVFTNGVFDVLHEGHLALLERAKQEGDYLIVGVNTDDSVRRLKGPERPVFPLEKRMRMLAGLSAVDFVVSFSEDTPLHLIQTLLPDVLVKGGDYTEKTVVGADMVKKHGGNVVIVPLLAGHSSTNIINRLSNKTGKTVL